MHDKVFTRQQELVAAAHKNTTFGGKSRGWIVDSFCDYPQTDLNNTARP
jgi:hypothetical protein